MIEVEVRRHDVADVVDAEAEIGDMAQRRFRHLEPRPHQRPEQEPEPARIADVLYAEPAIDQDESVVALDQQAVAAHRRGRPRSTFAPKKPPAARTQRSAVEMVNSH